MQTVEKYKNTKCITNVLELYKYQYVWKNDWIEGLLYRNSNTTSMSSITIRTPLAWVLSQFEHNYHVFDHNLNTTDMGSSPDYHLKS